MDIPVAIVTGSGRRLGRRMAIALAENGFDVVINYKRSVAEAKKTKAQIEKKGRRCLLVKADVTKLSQVKRLMQAAFRKFGAIDLLVNNAAIFPPKSELPDVPERLWDRTLTTNLKSVFLCSQEAVRYMIRKKSGKIINIASLGAFLAWKNYIPYNVSKAGVVTLTKTMAKALAPYVTVNAIAPGTIIIPGEEEMEEHMPAIDKIPMKKYGKPSDITEAVIFLATASDYITGQVLAVDGGVTVL